MKIKLAYQLLSLAIVAIMASSCASTKVSTQTNDDVYFSDVSANKVVYTSVKTTNEPKYNDNYNDYYDESTVYSSRLNAYNLNSYTWRDYYYQNSILGYDPFFGPTNYYGSNNFYNSGWSFSLGLGSPYYGYNNYYSPYNFWNNFGPSYGYSGYGGLYSYYRPGNYGNYNNYGYGNNYYFDPAYNNRPNNPRPRGSYDNTRPTASAPRGGGSTISYPNPRPIRPDVNNPRDTRTTTDSRNSSGNGSQPSRPMRPTRTTSDTPRQPQSKPMSRPTRTEPSSPSNDGGRSSGGGSPSPRPTRTGGN